MRRGIGLVLLALVLIGGTSSARAADGDRPLRLAAPAVGEAAALDFAPFSARLAELLGRPVEVARPAGDGDLARGIGDGSIDLAVAGPVTYLALAAEGVAVRPLVRFDEGERGGTERCALVVFRGDRVAPEELSRVMVGVAAPPAACGARTAVALVRRVAGAGADDVRLGSVAAASDVALAVAAGDLRAGVVSEKVALRYAGLGLERLDVADPVPSLVLVARAGLFDDAAADRLRFELVATPEAVTRTWGAGLDGAVRTTSDSDFDVLRSAELRGRR